MATELVQKSSENRFTKVLKYSQLKGIVEISCGILWKMVFYRFSVKSGDGPRSQLRRNHPSWSTVPLVQPLVGPVHQTEN